MQRFRGLAGKQGIIVLNSVQHEPDKRVANGRLMQILNGGAHRRLKQLMNAGNTVGRRRPSSESVQQWNYIAGLNIILRPDKKHLVGGNHPAAWVAQNWRDIAKRNALGHEHIESGAS